LSFPEKNPATQKWVIVLRGACSGYTLVCLIDGRS
jgi:hypothetical protein